MKQSTLSPRTSNKTKNDTSDPAGIPGRKKPSQVKKEGSGRPPQDDDDDSVDSKGNIRNLIAYSEDEDESMSSSSSASAFVGRRLRSSAVKARKQIKKALKTEKKPVRPSVKKAVIESDTEDEMDVEDDDEEEYEDEDEDEDSEEEYEDSETEDSPKKRKGPAEISISFGTLEADNSERNIPKRHNMKKETSLVNKFVKLVTEPREDGGIDDQIDQFKALTADKQEQLVESLGKKPTQQENIMFKILTMNISDATRSLVLAKYNALQSMDPGSGEYFKSSAWLEKFVGLPLGIYKDMPVNLESGPLQCGEFMQRARTALSEAIYGQEESKLQILQFIATRIANPTARGASLLLIGPPGIGKTCLIKNGIAKALGWPFQFISLGGDSDATTYTGHQLVYEGSHAGKIANSLIAAKSMSLILMFDELDKISATPKGEEVQNLMIHMTDTVQNADFEDKYLSGVPLDLSRSMFVFSGNDITKIDKVLLDRMIVIQLKGYDKKEKLAIAEQFIVPSALKDVNLSEKVSISKEVLEHLITTYSGEEPGVRELKRCVEQITQKINMLRIFNTKELPFHIPDFTLPFIVKKAHIDLFLTKKVVEVDPSLRGMYT
jgi:ATP-dependent Lon protease